MFNFWKSTFIHGSNRWWSWSFVRQCVRRANFCGRNFNHEGEIGDKAMWSSPERSKSLKIRRTHSFAGCKACRGSHWWNVLVGSTPRFASGVAKTECDLLVIGHDSLDHLLDTSPSAARVILSTIANRLRNTELVYGKVKNGSIGHAHNRHSSWAEQSCFGRPARLGTFAFIPRIFSANLSKNLIPCNFLINNGHGQLNCRNLSNTVLALPCWSG